MRMTHLAPDADPQGARLVRLAETRPLFGLLPAIFLRQGEAERGFDDKR